MVWSGLISFRIDWNSLQVRSLQLLSSLSPSSNSPSPRSPLKTQRHSLWLNTEQHNKKGSACSNEICGNTKTDTPGSKILNATVFLGHNFKGELREPVTYSCLSWIQHVASRALQGHLKQSVLFLSKLRVSLNSEILRNSDIYHLG